MDENKITDKIFGEIFKTIKFLTPFAIIALIINVFTVISSAKHCYYYSIVNDGAMFLVDDNFKFSINDVMNFSVFTKKVWVIMAFPLFFYCIFTWIKCKKRFDFKISTHDFILVKLIDVLFGLYYMIASYIMIIYLDKVIIKNIIPEHIVNLSDFNEIYPRSLKINILIFAYAIFFIVVIFNFITTTINLGVNRALVRFILVTVIPFIPIGVVNYIAVIGQGIIFENEVIIFKLVIIFIAIFINFHECSKTLSCNGNLGGD